MKKGITFSLFFMFTSGLAQKPAMDFVAYTFDSGFPMNETYKVVQDKHKYLWFFNYQMIVRFDGANYVTYRPSRQNPHNLPPHSNGIATDRNGNIWLLNNSGISAFNDETQQFQNYDLHFLKGEIALSLIFDEQNTAFVGTSKGRVVVFNVASKKYIKSILVSDGDIGSMLFLDKKTLWIGSLAGIYELSLSSFQSQKIIETPFVAVATKRGVIALFKDTKNRVWASIARIGIWVIDPNTKKTIQVLNPKLGKEGNETYSILESKIEPNTLFFATAQGLYRYDTKSDTSFSYAPENKKNDIGTLWTSDLWEDDLGNLWVTGNGLFKYNKNSKLFTQHRFQNFWNPSMYFEEIDSTKIMIATSGYGLITYDTKNRKILKNILLSKLLDGDKTHDYLYTFCWQPDNSKLLIGGQSELLSYDLITNKALNLSKKYNLMTNHVFSIAQDQQKHFWVATASGIFLFDENHILLKKIKYPNIEVTANKLYFTSKVFCDRSGQIWVGALGLYRYDQKKNRFIKYTRFEGIEVRDILETQKDTIWCATSKGIIKTDKSGQTFELYDIDSGLSETYTHQIQADNNGNIWATGASGLNFLNPKTGQIRTYTTRDGLIQNLLLLGFCKGRYSQKMYASLLGENGFELFDPNEIGNKKNEEVDLRISQVKLGNGKIITPNKPIILSPDSPPLTIEFALMNFANVLENQYYYQFAGIDTAWNSLKNQNFVTFSNLQSGSYDLYIKARSPNGNFSKHQAHLKIQVTTPYYRTWWFFGLVFLAVASFFYGLYRYRLSQILKLQQLRNSISRDLHDEVGSTLSSISMLSESAQFVLESDQPKSKEIMQNISKNTQKVLESMDDIVWTINPNADSYENMVLRIREYTYATAEAKKITPHFDIDNKILHLKIVMKDRRNIYLILKESINNAIKHSNCTEIRISMAFERGYFLAIVKDNGKGFDTEKSTNRNGLRNMKQRAAEIGASLEISNKNGTEVAIKIKMA